MELRKPAIVFFISALILGIFSIFLIKNTEPVYGVNDDKIIESWVSGELMYLAESDAAPGSTRPPKATQRPSGSRIGKIRRSRKRS